MRDMRVLGTTLCIALVCSSCTLSEEMQNWESEYFTPSVRVYFDTGTDDENEVDLYKDGGMSPAVDFLAIQRPLLIRTSDDVAKRVLEKRREAARKMLAVEQTVAARSGNDGVQSARVQELDREVEELDLDLMRLDAQSAARDAARAKGTKLNGDWQFGPRFALGISSPASSSPDGQRRASGAPVVFASASVYADFYKTGSTVGEEAGVGVRLEFGTMYGISPDESLSDADDSAVFVGMTVFL